MMERRKFFRCLGTGTLAAGVTMPLMAETLGNSENMILKNGAVQHMVIFNLIHEKGSVQAEKFLADGRKILSHIPVVNNFQVFNQVSLKNDFTYGFSMVFADKVAYNTYYNHPDHVAFVAERWKKEVSKFLEIDFNLH